jgi:hypothetical protein
VDRQLSLFTYASVYHDHFLRGLDRIFDGPRLPSDPLELARTQIEGLHRQAQEVAERAAIYDGIPSWPVLRRLIYERDKGVCRVCRELIPPERYELGHLVDQCIGGLDVPSNVVVMCGDCNARKPVHSSRDEALAWCDTGVYSVSF